MTALCDLPFVLIFVAVIWFIGGEVALVVLAGVVLVYCQGFLCKGDWLQHQRKTRVKEPR